MEEAFPGTANNPNLVDPRSIYEDQAEGLGSPLSPPFPSLPAAVDEANNQRNTPASGVSTAVASSNKKQYESKAWTQIFNGMHTIQQLEPNLLLMAWFAGPNNRVHYEGNLSVMMGGKNVLTMLLDQLSSPLIQVRNNAVLRLSKAMDVAPELENIVDDWPRSTLQWGPRKEIQARKRKGGRKRLDQSSWNCLPWSSNHFSKKWMDWRGA
jgi:hypothetical protein